MSIQPKRRLEQSQMSNKNQNQKVQTLKKKVVPYQENIRFIKIAPYENYSERKSLTKVVSQETPFKHLQQFIQQEGQNQNTKESKEDLFSRKNGRTLFHSHSLKRVQKPKLFSNKNSQNSSVKDHTQDIGHFREEIHGFNQGNSQKLIEYYGLNNQAITNKLHQTNTSLLKRIQFLQSKNYQLSSQNSYLKSKMKQKQHFHSHQISLMKQKINSLQGKVEQLHRMFFSTSSPASSFQINISNDINSNYYS